MSSVSRDRLLPLGLQVFQGAHVVQPVGQFDQHHAHVTHHGQQHFAHILCLAVFAVGKLDLVDLGYAFNDVRHLVAELVSDLFAGCRSVFHGVVQQRRRHRGRIQLHLYQHLGHFKRVHNVGFPRGARLVFVMGNAELPRLSNQ